MVNVLSKYHDKTWAGIRGYGALDNYRQMQFVCKRADRMVSCTKVMEQEMNSLILLKIQQLCIILVIWMKSMYYPEKR